MKDLVTIRNNQIIALGQIPATIQKRAKSCINNGGGHFEHLL
jgi:hypothetical protein